MKQIRMAAAVSVYCLLPFFSTALGAENIPAEVQAFIADRRACDHFRGEPWDVGDQPEVRGRREFILESIQKYCTGTDKRLEFLRSKYKNDSRIIEHLRKYEERIEMAN
jgi:hypothetical protein